MSFQQTRLIGCEPAQLPPLCSQTTGVEAKLHELAPAWPCWSTSAVWRHRLKFKPEDSKFLPQPPRGCSRSVSQKGGAMGAVAKSGIWPVAPNVAPLPLQWYGLRRRNPCGWKDHKLQSPNWVWIPPLPPPCCVNCSKLFNRFGIQYPQL